MNKNNELKKEKSKRLTIKDVDEKLNKEINKINNLEIFTKQIWNDLNYLGVNIKEDITKKRGDIISIEKTFDKKIEKIEKIKEELLEHTLHIIAIVVAILAIILTFAFLSTEMYKAPDRFTWVLTGTILYFCVIFTLYVSSWRKRNKYVVNFDGDYMVASNRNNPDGNNISISDWIQFLKQVSSINTTMLSSFSTSYFVVIAIILSAVVYLGSPWNLPTIAIPIKELILAGILGAAIFVIILNIWYHYYYQSSKKKQLAERLLVDIVVNHRFKTVKEIEDKWKAEDRKIRNSGKFEKYKYE